MAGVSGTGVQRRDANTKHCLEGGFPCLLKDWIRVEERGGGGLGECCRSNMNQGMQLARNTSA